MKNEAATGKLKISILRFNPRAWQRAAHADLRDRRSGKYDAVHRANGDSREARSVPAVRLRLPRRHLRQLRHDDQRPSDPRLPHVNERLGHRDLAGAAAGLRADWGLVGGYRQVDARHERAIGDLASHEEQEPDLRRLEERMEPELAEKIYELDRCIECGCCVAGCGTARMREDLSARWGSTRSPASVSTRATGAAMRTISN